MTESVQDAILSMTSALGKVEIQRMTMGQEMTTILSELAKSAQNALDRAQKKLAAAKVKAEKLAKEQQTWKTIFTVVSVVLLVGCLLTGNIVLAAMIAIPLIMSIDTGKKNADGSSQTVSDLIMNGLANDVIKPVCDAVGIKTTEKSRELIAAILVTAVVVLAGGALGGWSAGVMLMSGATAISSTNLCVRGAAVICEANHFSESSPEYRNWMIAAQLTQLVIMVGAMVVGGKSVSASVKLPGAVVGMGKLLMGLGLSGEVIGNVGLGTNMCSQAQNVEDNGAANKELVQGQFDMSLVTATSTQIQKELGSDARAFNDMMNYAGYANYLFAEASLLA